MMDHCTLVVLAAVGIVATISGVVLTKRDAAERQGLGETVLEQRTLSHPIARCEVKCCQREASEFDLDRMIWLCEVHAQPQR